MRHKCPNDHDAVIRHDPDTTGFIAMCDRCGWSAPYVVAREESDWRREENHELAKAIEAEDRQRKQVTAGGEASRRRGD